MKKIAALIAAAVVASASNAAVYNVLGTSNISGWQAVNGVGGGVYSPFFADLKINLSGTVTTSSGFSLSGLTLNQVGTATGTSALGGVMTLSGASWTLGTNANDQATSATSDFALLQTGGTAACNPSTIDCSSVAAAITAGGAASAINFDGIFAGENYLGADFQPVLEGPKGGATFAGVVPNFAGPGTVRLIYTLNAYTLSSGAFFNSNNRLTLTLDLAPTPEVPVPAAAWLMGSGLIGLAGIARRRKMAQ